MKKILSLLLTMFLLISATTTVMASNDIKVKIDGQQIAFDVPPQIIKGRTMVPLRAIFEALGATVDWDEHTHTVRSTKGDITVSLTVNYPRIDINGEDVQLDSAPKIVNGRTLVPVRAISEAFKADVEWVESERTVVITTNGNVVQNKPSEETNIVNNNQNDNSLVYEDSKVKIKFLRVEKRKYSDDEVKVFCEAENKTNETLKIYCDALSFDGHCFNYVIMSNEISAGDVATIDTIIKRFDFSLVDINDITSFGGQFRIVSKNGNFKTYNAPFISKNLYNNKIEKSYPTVTGKELIYSDDRINMYFDYAENDDEDFEIYLTVQNKTDDTVLIQNNYVVVEGNTYKNTIISDNILAYTTGKINVTLKNLTLGSVSTIGGEFKIISENDSFESYEAIVGNIN